MRGDMRSNRSNRQDVIPADSSSSGSSPRSSSSRDEDILEVSGPEFIPKPIYNFSIPDVIKHEHRDERQDITDRLIDNDDDEAIPLRRKRKHTDRQQTFFNNMNNNERTTVLKVNNKRRKKGVSGAAAVIAETTNNPSDELRATGVRSRDHNNDDVINDDDDCHRSRQPPVIDLTDIDSHDEYHSDSELNSTMTSRPLSHYPAIPGLEHFRRQLQDSRSARDLFRSPSVQRLHRLRRFTTQIINNGSSQQGHHHHALRHSPIVTTSSDDMMLSTPEPLEVTTPEQRTSADDSIVVINEVRPGQRDSNDDHSIAMRMASDPMYSPPYNTPSTGSANQTTKVRLSKDVDVNIQYNRRHQRLTAHRNDESFSQFQERVRLKHRRSRERLERARQISLEAQERLVRIHDSINSLRHRRLSSSSPEENQVTNNNRDTDDSTEEQNDDGNDEVEITHEWNPNDPEYPTLDFDLPRPVSLFPTYDHFQVTSVRSFNRRHLPMPDFLRPLMSSFLPPPRLQHFHFQEDYEALLNLAEHIGPAKPRGLNKTEIDLIPSFRFSSVTAKETNSKCVICMGEYANREKLRRLPCTHDFHSKCIDKWLKSTKTCPVCRDEVNPTAA